ncbi:thiol reductase thioredoxin [Brevibacillus reuszeri]|uniref:Thioredoxin n=1 Tax=Brevibacillus reuszeri TaxID=54915 RepID=A0A0K9Z000_9BACL|nr:thioredoxin family protein [Brevibacillus reuszeri]KNB74274.1 thioredoxin [Brevibacillus reuszeri]MED1856160.1 thioredoxin family protein [Brevibacillus reuszeri]GED68154.1 thiol reductase thioredoxin [Brevibacillus reuszeri]
MREYTRLAELKEEIERHAICLLFIKMANCGVCDATYEKTTKLLESYPQVVGAAASIEKIPSISGEFLVFTAPTVLLFIEGKEVFRQSRIVAFQPFEKVVKQAVEASTRPSSWL